MSLLQQAAILAGLSASGFYIYSELEKRKNTGPKVDDSGQTNITEGGTDAFQQIDRTFAYTLLLKAHSDITDFDTLTDSDLAQLLSAINIDPDVLRTHMTQEQSDFLIHSAEQAARLRVEITIDQATKAQWNVIIRAQKKSVNEDWALQRRGEIDVKFASDPYQEFYTLNWSDFMIHHGGMLGMAPVDVDSFYSFIGKFSSDNHIRTWTIEKAAMYPMTMLFIDHIGELNDELKGLREQRKQEAMDLLAVNLTSKNAIVDSTDYVAMGYKIDVNNNIIAPPEV